MYACVFMALIPTLVLCARSQNLVMSVSMRRVHVVLSALLDLLAEESRVVRHVKPPRWRETSRSLRALSRFRTQAIGIGALAQGFYPLSYPSAKGCCVFPPLSVRGVHSRFPYTSPLFSSHETGIELATCDAWANVLNHCPTEVRVQRKRTTARLVTLLHLVK